PNHLRRVLAMVEERNELGDRPFEIDVIFPERVIGIDEQSLGAILSPHGFMITAQGAFVALTPQAVLVFRNVSESSQRFPYTHSTRGVCGMIPALCPMSSNRRTASRASSP